MEDEKKVTEAVPVERKEVTITLNSGRSCKIPLTEAEWSSMLKMIANGEPFVKFINDFGETAISVQSIESLQIKRAEAPVETEGGNG